MWVGSGGENGEDEKTEERTKCVMKREKCMFFRVELRQGVGGDFR